MAHGQTMQSCDSPSIATVCMIAGMTEHMAVLTMPLLVNAIACDLPRVIARSVIVTVGER